MSNTQQITLVAVTVKHRRFPKTAKMLLFLFREWQLGIAGELRLVADKAAEGNPAGFAQDIEKMIGPDTASRMVDRISSSPKAFGDPPPSYPPIKKVVLNCCL